MIKIEIKNRFTGTIIFEFSKENNTLKDTLKEYIRLELEKGKTYADLRYADLTSADLTSANLTSADLTSADLRYADLRYADLRYADLRYADLTSANLTSAKNKELANLPIFCKWVHSIVGDKIKIGCETRTIADWDLFFTSNNVLTTERNTDEFKQIEAVYLSYKAYLTHLKP